MWRVGVDEALDDVVEWLDETTTELEVEDDIEDDEVGAVVIDELFVLDEVVEDFDELEATEDDVDVDIEELETAVDDDDVDFETTDDEEDVDVDVDVEDETEIPEELVVTELEELVETTLDELDALLVVDERILLLLVADVVFSLYNSSLFPAPQYLATKLARDNWQILKPRALKHAEHWSCSGDSILKGKR